MNRRPVSRWVRLGKREGKENGGKRERGGERKYSGSDNYNNTKKKKEGEGETEE